MSKSPNDKKNIERQAKLRYAIQSGQSSIHGDTNYEIQTQEAQSFGFYASTGQGASEGGGPGTGKHVLYTPGSSTEVLGEGLKVRKPGDISQLPAKIVKCKRGDMVFECENGNILLRAKNIFVDAMQKPIDERAQMRFGNHFYYAKDLIMSRAEANLLIDQDKSCLPFIKSVIAYPPSGISTLWKSLCERQANQPGPLHFLSFPLTS